MSAEKVPLRPASPIDAELAKPHPEDMTEIEKEIEIAEDAEEADDKTQDELDRKRARAGR
jgi:hypothetical protein